MNEKFNKNAKVEQLTKIFLAVRKKKALLLKILYNLRVSLDQKQRRNPPCHRSDVAYYTLGKNWYYSMISPHLQ